MLGFSQVNFFYHTDAFFTEKARLRTERRTPRRSAGALRPRKKPLQQNEKNAERRREIIAKANDREFQDAFSPFLAHAPTRVGGGKYLIGEHPAAFTDIQRRGGFQSPESLKFLTIHPDGGMGRRLGKKSGWETAVRRFPHFEEVARVWVDQCKLLYSPEDAGKPCTPKE